MLQWQGDSMAIEQEYQAAMAETGARYALRIAQEKRTPGNSSTNSRRLEAQEKARLAQNRAVALKKAIEQRNTLISTTREKVEHQLAAVDSPETIQVDVTPTASGPKDKSTSRICVSCATPFTARTSWQRFCNTTCRLEYHGKKHGKPYLPRKLYQARRREAGKAVVGLFG